MGLRVQGSGIRTAREKELRGSGLEVGVFGLEVEVSDLEDSV